MKMYIKELFAVLYYISCGFVHASGERQTLTLLSILPYPDSVPSLQPSITLGPEIEPVIELAVQQINNRSDILSDYSLELVTADGGCNVPSKAIISLLSHVFHSGKRIAGIIGPLCSDASEAVGRLIRRPEISLISVHRGNHFGLADRTLYPNSLGIAGSTFSLLDAYVALVEYNNWTTIAALYNNQMLVDYGTFLQFEKDVKSRTSTTIIFSSHASPLYIPLEQLNQINVRVIFAILREPFLLELLCIAYHKEMIFPNYQWILLNRIAEVMEVEVSYKGENYVCTMEQMINATHGSLVFLRVLSIDETTISISGMNSSEFHSFHEARLPTNVSSISPFPTGRFYYDALWAIALALNNSIDDLHLSGFSLSNYTYGQKGATDIIREEMYKLNFQGISGEIQFDRRTGFREHIIFFQELFNGEYQLIGGYNNKTLEINESAADILVASEFKTNTVHIRVSTVSVVIFIIADFVAVVLVVTAHVINTTYRNIPSIKASSVRLNHFAYTGCYFILSAVVFYTVTEAGDANEASKTVLCNFVPWCIAIGSTLVFGTVCVKTWRLYRILMSSQKVQRAIKDSILAVVITVMTLFSVILCLVWSVVDPLTRTTEKTIVTHELATVKEQCECNNIWVWLLLIAFYETFLLGSSSLFAVRSRNIRLKDFQTHGIIILSILLLVTSVVGMGIFLITSSVDNISVDIPYIFLCLVLCAGVYLCFFLLFFPPIRPVLIEKWLPVIRNVCGLQSRKVSSKFDVETFDRPATVISNTNSSYL